MLQKYKVIGIYGMALSLLLLVWNVACSKTEPTEAQKETVITKEIAKEIIPEDASAEKTPDTAPPVGVGEVCQPSPKTQQGTCPNKELLCLPISDTQSKCFENCTNNNLCNSPSESCLHSPKSGYKACYKKVNAGEKCDINERTVCKGELSNPPEYCIQGTCKARPQAGWSLGDSCTAPRGDKQSDCQKGLVCLSVASEDYRCIQACTQDSECPNGEICWEEPFQEKVCVIAAKKGEKCAKTERRFCKNADANEKLICQNSLCSDSVVFKEIGESCKQSFDPNDTKGDCKQGLLCLGVSTFEARCHKACSNDSNCPSGEACQYQPNNGKLLTLACVIPIEKDGGCNLKERKLCKVNSTTNLRCKTPDENTAAGTCIQVEFGDACNNDGDCGKYRCFAIGDPKDRYCLQPCNAQTACPGNGVCGAFIQDGPTGCAPAGIKKEDEVCQPSKKTPTKLEYQNDCESGFSCMVVKQGATDGICMQLVAQCIQGACKTANHLCIPLQNNGVCAFDCSQDATRCQGGSTCTEVSLQSGKVNICAAP